MPPTLDTKGGTSQELTGQQSRRLRSRKYKAQPADFGLARECEGSVASGQCVGTQRPRSTPLLNPAHLSRSRLHISETDVVHLRARHGTGHISLCCCSSSCNSHEFLEQGTGGVGRQLSIVGHKTDTVVGQWHAFGRPAKHGNV